MTSPTGERDNVERLHARLGMLMPPGRVLMLDVEHDDGCPCTEDDRAALDRCTCASVDLTLSTIDAVTS